ncbi:MAG: type II toxin-antitoxin system RelE/ParE family toxin [Xanthobacteraceae bacterium]
MTRLVVTADAEADTRDILVYLEQQAGRPVAADYAHRFSWTIERLVSMPEIGAPWPSLGLNTRVAVVFPYILIYDYAREDDTLTLLRILHGRRNISRDLLQR